MNKVKAYGFCDAGCKRRVPLYEEFERSAAYIQHRIDEDGTAELSPFAKYIITSTPRAESIVVETSLPTTVSLLTEYATAEVDGVVYFFGGKKGSAYNRVVYKYEAKTGTFTQVVATLPLDLNLSYAVPIEKKIYIFGGLNNGYCSDKQYVFDTESETITESGTNNKNVRGAVAAVNDDIYILGGATDSSSQTKQVYKYNVTENNLEQVGELPYAVTKGCAAVVGTKIYVFSGYGVGSATYTMSFDTITKKSELLKDLAPQQTQINFASAVSSGTKIYIFGGTIDTGNTSNPSSDIYIYDTITDTVTKSNTSLLKTSDIAHAEIIGNDIYIFDDEVSPLNVQKYNYDTYECTAKIEIPQAEKSIHFDIAIDDYDAYRNNFELEVLAVENVNGNTRLVYELNGQRKTVEFAGESDGATAVLTISGANEVLQYNSNSLIQLDPSAEYEAKLGDIETALDEIIAIQNGLIGGDE